MTKNVFTFIIVMVFCFSNCLAQNKILVLLNKHVVTFGIGALKVQKTDVISIRIYAEPKLLNQIQGINLFGCDECSQCQTQVQSKDDPAEPFLNGITKARNGQGYVEYTVTVNTYKLCPNEQFELAIATGSDAVSKIKGYSKLYKFKL